MSHRLGLRLGAIGQKIAGLEDRIFTERRVLFCSIGIALESRSEINRKYF